MKKYLGTVVPTSFLLRRSIQQCSRIGSFVYVPPGVRCPMELSTYFASTKKTPGSSERALIASKRLLCQTIIRKCTARCGENQLHAAVR